MTVRLRTAWLGAGGVVGGHNGYIAHMAGHADDNGGDAWKGAAVGRADMSGRNRLNGGFMLL
jgi:hypothetical protein